MTLFARRPDGFSEVLKTWQDEIVCCIGGGPGLTQEQVDFVRGKARVIAINNAYLLAPWADVLYFADAPTRWYGWHRDRPEFKAFRGEKVTIEACAPGNENKQMPLQRKGVADESVHILRNLGVEELSTDPSGLRNGRNSGHQGVNLAALASSRILLLGYDMRFQNGLSHCALNHKDGHHPDPNTEAEFSGYARTFSTMKPALDALGVEVINCSPGSALDAFPRIPLDLVKWFQCAALTA